MNLPYKLVTSAQFSNLVEGRRKAIEVGYQKATNACTDLVSSGAAFVRSEMPTIRSLKRKRHPTPLFWRRVTYILGYEMKDTCIRVVKSSQRLPR